jgi:hemerythrin-like metal-binding protein
MAFFEWSDNLSVGISVVDRDHKLLIDCVNQLYEAVVAGCRREVLDPLLSRLIAVTEDHFLREEIIWEDARYIDLDRHKEQHADLLRTAREFQAKYRARRVALSVDIMRALHGWVSKHIAMSDKEAADSLGVAARAELNASPTT